MPRSFHRWSARDKDAARERVQGAKLTQDNSTPRRWIVLDAGLFDDKGHHRGAAEALVRELRRRSLPVTVYCHRAARLGLLQEIDPIPWFRSFVYAATSADPLHGEYQDYVAGNRSFAEDLAALPAAPFEAGDTLLFPTIHHHHLHAIVHWASTLPVDRHPKIVAVLMFPPDWAPAIRPFSNPAAYYAAAWRSRPPQMGPRLHLGTETLALSKAYAEVLGFRPVVLPRIAAGVENASMQSKAAEREPSQQAPLIAYLGHGRPERGFHLLPEIVTLAQRSAPPHRFFVQCCYDGQPDFQAAERMLAAHAHVRIHAGTMEQADYHHALASADFMLLPYHPGRYKTRGSGVFFEASIAGIPPIVPADTWMAREVEENGTGVTFAEFEARSIVGALRGALERRVELARRAQSRVRELRREHGAASFIDRIERL